MVCWRSNGPAAEQNPGFLLRGLDDPARSQAARADAHAADAAVDHRANALQVGLEAPGPDVVGVADDAPDHGRLAAHFTLFRHVIPQSDPFRSQKHLSITDRGNWGHAQLPTRTERAGLNV